jgi:hypothetical protein
MCQVWVRGDVYAGLVWGNLKEKDLLEDLDLDGRILNGP